ncbi:MAG: hypothetical protein HFH08_04335 [Bacilli bacterium]|nr:hypothetical protein [Bacilli bacterium]
MIQFDHIAVTVDNLESSIQFYEKLGYQLQHRFSDQEYRWATLKLGTNSLEIFEPVLKESPKIEHLAYSFTEDQEAFELAKKLGTIVDETNLFYGDLNRKSFFLEQDEGIAIQFIKKI